MEKELKPCPFCGSEAEIVTTEIYPSLNVVYVPRCTNRLCVGRVTKKFVTYEKALADWNKRR